MSEIGNAIKDADRNKIALILSVFPGAGHLYKRYFAAGWGILIGGNILVLFIALWLFIATAGLSLIILPLLWIGGVAWSAYLLPDRHEGGSTPPPRMTEDGRIRDPAQEDRHGMR